MSARVHHLGFLIPIEIAAASTFRQCDICNGGPLYRYTGPGTCSRCRQQALRVFKAWNDETMCWPCLDDAVQAQLRRQRGISQHPRSAGRPTEAVVGDDREPFLWTWTMRKHFWDRELE